MKKIRKNEATTEEGLLVNREKVQLRSTLLTTVEKQIQNCKKTRSASERASKASKAGGEKRRCTGIGLSRQRRPTRAKPT
jgi:hypothetical protein